METQASFRKGGTQDGSLNHAVVSAVDWDLGAGGGVEDGAGDGADHGGDAGGGDFGVEEVFGFVFLDGHAVALGRFFERFLGPDFGVEDGIGMEHVDADSEFGELESSHAGELGHAGFGDRVGRSAWSGSGEVARADDDDAGLLVALLECGDGVLEEALGGGEVDLEVQVPRVGFRIDILAGFEDAGIGDNKVEPAVVGDDFVDGGLQRCIVGDVADGSGKALASEVGDDVGIDVETDNGGSVVAKAFGCGATNATAGSGDDCDFIGMDLFGHDDVFVRVEIFSQTAE